MKEKERDKTLAFDPLKGGQGQFLDFKICFTPIFLIHLLFTEVSYFTPHYSYDIFLIGITKYWNFYIFLNKGNFNLDFGKNPGISILLLKPLSL